MNKLFGTALLWLALASAAGAQMRSEMRDPVRGVSFHSLEFSDHAITGHHVIEGEFKGSDRLAAGLSTMIFDGATEIDSYILWIRHQGREWLDHELADSVQVVADGGSLEIDQLRSPQRFPGAGGLVYEKLEFVMDADEMSHLLTSDSATISIRSDNGEVEKPITEEELGRIRTFIRSIESTLVGRE